MSPNAAAYGEVMTTEYDGEEQYLCFGTRDTFSPLGRSCVDMSDVGPVCIKVSS